MEKPLAAFPLLDSNHARLLSRIGITKASEIWAAGPTELAKKLKMNPEEFQAMLDAVCAAIAPKPQSVNSFSTSEPSCFTTGDASLDKALGGGVRVGMVTEICGES